MSKKLPVLLLGYNRPDFTRDIMIRLAEYAPDRLYIACDGPNSSKPGDRDLVLQVREHLKGPAWPCTVHKRFLNENVGPRQAVGTAIDWFFTQETKGVILEDDCMPHVDFFKLADHILHRYRNDKKIWGVTGSNTTRVDFRGEASYGFVGHPLTWGWASWRDRWSERDADLQTYSMNRSTVGEGGFPSRAHQIAFSRHLDSIVECGVPDAWDYPWAWTVMRHGGLWAVAQRNLVKNVGFRYDSTNTTTSRLMGGPLENLEEVIDPIQVILDHEAESVILRKIHGLLYPLWLNHPVNLLKLVKRRITRRFRRRDE